MHKIQIAQLAWAAKKNKENIDLSMREMGKSLENIITAMAAVDPKLTLEILNDISHQVKTQSKNYEMDIIEEKSVFIDAILEELAEEEEDTEELKVSEVEDGMNLLEKLRKKTDQ